MATSFVTVALSLLFISPSRECTTTCVDVAFGEVSRVSCAKLNASSKRRLPFVPTAPVSVEP